MRKRRVSVKGDYVVAAVVIGGLVVELCEIGLE